MPLLYIAVIDLCFILDVDVPLICALITAVYRILTFIEKRFDQRETRQSPKWLVTKCPCPSGEKYLICFKRFARAKTGYGTIFRNPICRT